MELVPHSLYELIQQIKRHDRSPFTPDEIITCISHMAKGNPREICDKEKAELGVLCAGLMYLHGLPDKVIHRDIKSKNVLIELVLLRRLFRFGMREYNLSEYNLSCMRRATIRSIRPSYATSESARSSPRRPKPTRPSAPAGNPVLFSSSSIMLC